VELSYVKPIEVVPGFEYPWNFTLRVDGAPNKAF